MSLESLYICLLIDALFVLIVSSGRVYIGPVKFGGNVKKYMLQTWTRTLIDDINLFMSLIFIVRYHIKACLFEFHFIEFLSGL